MINFNDIIQDTAGNSLSGATVSVYFKDTTDLVPIYTDSLGISEKDNPFSTSTSGQFDFWITPGIYDVSIAKEGYTTKELTITLSDSPEYYPNYKISNHAVSSTQSLAYLITKIGSNKATIIFEHHIGNEYTDYAIGTSMTIPDNITIIVRSGARIALTNATLTIAGRVIADRQQIFAFSGSSNVIFSMNCQMTDLPIEWFGLDADGFTEALYAAQTAYLSLSLGNSVLDLGNDIVTISANAYSKIKGFGPNRSRILIGDGTLRLSTSVCRMFQFEDLLITSTGTSNKMIELYKDGSGGAPTELSFTRCRLAGGGYSVYSEGGGIQLSFIDSLISNDHDGRYAIYINQQSPPATPYFNGVNLNNTRIAGNCYFYMDRTFNMIGTILECSYGSAALYIKGVKGGGITQSYFETEGITPIELDDEVYGFQIKGNSIDKGNGAVSHIKCDGQCVEIGQNKFITIESGQTIIHLESNSERCRVLENHGGDYGDVPKVQNDGTDNYVWGMVEEKIWISVNDLFPIRSTFRKNYMPNYSFENFTGTADDDTTDDFDDWTEVNTDASNRLEAVSDSFDGDYALKIVKTAGGNPYVYQDIDVSSLPVQRLLRLSFYTKGDGSYAGMYRIYDVTNGAHILAKTTTNISGTEWDIFQYRFIRPIGCNTIRVYFFGPDSVAGTCYFDNVILQEEADIVPGLGLPYYSLAQDVATYFEKTIKLPNNIVNRNGTNNASIIFEVYFKAPIEHNVVADWVISACELNEDEVPRNPALINWLTAESGSHSVLTGGNILKILKCTLPTMTMESTSSKFLQMRGGRAGTGLYNGDLYLYGILIRILHTTY